MVKLPAALQKLLRTHCQQAEMGAFLDSSGVPAVKKRKEKKGNPLVEVEPYGGMTNAALIPPLLLAHLLSKYLSVRWAQIACEKMSGYLCPSLISFKKAALNCFQMAPEWCLSSLEMKNGHKASTGGAGCTCSHDFSV